MTSRRTRIGIDTGGTFTDVVALDEDSGELVTTKTPSTPANPADGDTRVIGEVVTAAAWCSAAACQGNSSWSGDARGAGRPRQAAAV